MPKIYDTDKDAQKVIRQGIRFDIACGNAKKQGFTGIDISEDTQADIVMDLEVYPWKKIKSNVAVEIFCSHYIEHTSDIKSFMEEIYRICQNKAIVTFLAPYYSSIRAMQDFTHKRFISENTFLYFNQGWRKANKLEHYGVNCSFDICSVKYIYNAEWATRAEAVKEWGRKHHINVVDDIEVILRVNK